MSLLMMVDFECERVTVATNQFADWVEPELWE